MGRARGNQQIILAGQTVGFAEADTLRSTLCRPTSRKLTASLYPRQAARPEAGCSSGDLGKLALPMSKHEAARRLNQARKLPFQSTQDTHFPVA